MNLGRKHEIGAYCRSASARMPCPAVQPHRQRTGRSLASWTILADADSPPGHRRRDSSVGAVITSSHGKQARAHAVPRSIICAGLQQRTWTQRGSSCEPVLRFAGRCRRWTAASFCTAMFVTACPWHAWLHACAQRGTASRPGCPSCRPAEPAGKRSSAARHESAVLRAIGSEH
jgi:hypothetical protein